MIGARSVVAASVTVGIDATPSAVATASTEISAQPDPLLADGAVAAADVADWLTEADAGAAVVALLDADADADAEADAGAAVVALLDAAAVEA